MKTEDFEEYLNNIKFDDKPDYAHRNKLEKELLKHLSTQSRHKTNVIWKLNNRILKLTAAAILTFGIFLGINQFLGDTGKVYGMSDVPNLFFTADTIHIKGRMYFPEVPGIEPIDTEYWLDLVNKRWRKTNVTSIYSAGGVEISISEDVCDGSNYEMTIDHTNKKVSFSKMSRFQRSLSNRRNIGAIMNLISGVPEEFDEFTRIREENIDGRIYQVWEIEVSQVLNKVDYRVQSWLSPETGDVAEVIVWTREAGQDWKQKMQMYLIERNITIDDDIFSLQIPADYTSANTKETAPIKPIGASIGGAGDYRLITYLLFLLPDGSLVLCWGSDNTKIQTSQQELFKDLEVGGDFPKLPFQIDSLDVNFKNKKVTFSGHHLAYTTKDGKFYEWGIYTPSRQIEAKYAKMLIFNIVYSDNIDNPKITGSFGLSKSADIWIKNSDDFNEIFIAAIEEMSDQANIPEELNYESVMQLATELCN